MGRVSKEFKEIKEKNREYPVDGVDYHIVTFKYREMAWAGWVSTAWKKVHFTRDAIISGLKNPPQEARRVTASRAYYLYPGPRPNKKWGPVCP